MSKLFCFFLLCGIETSLGAPSTNPIYLSPEYVVPTADGKGVLVTCATSARVMCVDLKGKKLFDYPLSRVGEPAQTLNPTGVACAPDAIYVTCGLAPGELHKLNSNGQLIARTELGHSPCAPCVSKDGQKVYVLNRFTHLVHEVDAHSLRVLRTASVLREPVACALGGNEKFLFVANLLPDCAATNDLVAACVSRIQLSDFSLTHLMLPNGSTGVRGMTSSRDGKFIYVTHTMGRYQLPTTQLERGWMNTAALSIFDAEKGTYVNTVLLDDVDRGAANPWGVAVSDDDRTLLVTHAGTREVSVIDRLALHVRLDKAAHGESVSGIVKTPEDVPNDLAFLVSIRTRHLVGGDGPRGITTLGRQVVSALYFAEALSVLDLDSPTKAPRLIALAAAPDLSKDRVRRGEMLFHDGSMCFQKWQSCATCHPDGRVDGLNWDLLNDGMGNPKQTKSELLVHCTPPTMVTGIRKDMHACNQAGLVHIQFVVRPEEDVFCFDAYCEKLRPVPSPHLVKGQLSEKAKRGEKVFKLAKCADCHVPQAKSPEGIPVWTDCKSYDVGLGTFSESKRLFDTPTLTECWRTAPYLYDGRARTIREVLTTCNPSDTHGETSRLTPAQLDELEAYILSL